ncbi:T9SS type A sorting domain-containing protein [bacterium]|nr:T9SS type A sorting domain-containing protein [bacterium]
MLGSPYRYITDLEEAEVTIELDGEDVTMSWGDAVEAEYVTPVIYNFFHNEGDPELGGLYWEKTRFHPWYGYWYLVLANDVSLTLNRTEPYPGPERDDVDDYSVNDWHLQVLASVEGALDDLRLGVFEGASDGFANRFDYPEPPVAPIENPIRAYFERGDWNRHIGTMYNRDIREPMERGDSDEWTFQVQPSNDAEVTLSWPNFTRTIPRGDCWYEFYLVDEVNDRTINMRAEESYTYQSEGTNDFTIRVESSLRVSDNQTQPENFNLVEIYPNPFNSSTTINYNVKETMRLTLTLFDVKGRLVEILSNDIVSSGNHTQVYSGLNIDSGVYFLQISGESQSQLRKIVLMK